VARFLGACDQHAARRHSHSGVGRGKLHGGHSPESVGSRSKDPTDFLGHALAILQQYCQSSAEGRRIPLQLDFASPPAGCGGQFVTGRACDHRRVSVWAFVFSRLNRGWRHESRLKFCDFAEVEVANLHCRNDHLERFFSGGAHSRTQHLDIRQHLEDALVEPKISDAAGDPAIFD
jgi:hypothetical protein